MPTPFYRSDVDIERIARGFLALDLPKREWTHAAHFAVTLWLMRCRPDLDLVSRMPHLIRIYNAAAGGVNSDSEGYHETITQASLRAARAFLDRYADSVALHEIVDALMASPLGRPDWLLAYWSKDRLMSVEARRGWIDPDVQALPF